MEIAYRLLVMATSATNKSILLDIVFMDYMGCVSQLQVGITTVEVLVTINSNATDFN